jgi:hypothetical protein
VHVIKVMTRRSRDLSYLVEDPARELEGLRDGPALWWPRRDETVREPEQVLSTSSRSLVVGYDLVVAAPRCVSTLIAVDERSAPGVVAAHREAVGAALDYLEERGVVVRDRRGGADVDLPGRWTSVAAFTHGLNRHGEPHLHDHVVVGARPTSRDAVLDVRALRAHAVAGDALYRAQLRHGVAERTEWRAWRSRGGVEHVAGLDEGYRALWPGHHATRGEKLHWSRDRARDTWGHDLARYEALGEVRAPPRRAVLDEYGFAASLEGRQGVTRRDVVGAWADAAADGARARDVLGAVDHLFPRARVGRGVHEVEIAPAAARMFARVREAGPRPVELDELRRWDQRSRELGRSRDSR